MINLNKSPRENARRRPAPIPAGWAVACSGTFYGVGDTLEIALAQAREFSDSPVPEWPRFSTRPEGWCVMQLTAALREKIQNGSVSDGYNFDDAIVADVKS